MRGSYTRGDGKEVEVVRVQGRWRLPSTSREQQRRLRQQQRAIERAGERARKTMPDHGEKGTNDDG